MTDRRNISLPEDINDKLDQPHINASGLIQDLLRAYFSYGDIEQAAEYTAEKREDHYRQRLGEMVEKLTRETDDGEIEIVPEPWDQWNDAALNWGGKLEIPPEQVVEIVEHYSATGEIEIDP